jgi:hypothetical protein
MAQSARDVARTAKETLQELTGFPPEAVTGVERNGDGNGWLVTVDVLELERIPSTTDVLASYEVELDDSGELVSFKRGRRFQRSQAEEG